MMNILIPADISNNFYNSLNMAVMFEQFESLEVNMVFDSGIKEEEVQLKFGEIVNNYLPCFVKEDSNLKYAILQSKLEKELEDLIIPDKENIIFSTYHKNQEGSDKNYNSSNTLKRIKSSRVNILAIPTEKIPDGVKRIIFPVHLLSKVRHKVTMTLKLAKLFNAQVNILTTLTSNQPATTKRIGLYAQQVNKHFRSMGIPTVLDTVEGANAVDLIVDYAARADADLISVIPEENPGGIFSKGYITEMIEKSSIPLFVIPWRKLRL